MRSRSVFESGQESKRRRSWPSTDCGVRVSRGDRETPRSLWNQALPDSSVCLNLLVACAIKEGRTLKRREVVAVMSARNFPPEERDNNSEVSRLHWSAGVELCGVDRESNLLPTSSAQL